MAWLTVPTGRGVRAQVVDSLAGENARDIGGER